MTTMTPEHDRWAEFCKRLGCVICPFERKVAKSMDRWPRVWGARERTAKRYHDQKPRTCSFETMWANWLSRHGRIFTDEVDEDDKGVVLFT